jgi:hypothetical protein
MYLYLYLHVGEKQRDFWSWHKHNRVKCISCVLYLGNLKAWVLSIYLLISSQKVKAMGGRSKLHDEETHDLYSTPNIIRVIKARTKWVGHVARMRTKNRTHNPTRRRKWYFTTFLHEMIVLTVTASPQHATCSQLVKFQFNSKNVAK